MTDSKYLKHPTDALESFHARLWVFDCLAMAALDADDFARRSGGRNPEPAIDREMALALRGLYGDFCRMKAETEAWLAEFGSKPGGD